MQARIILQKKALDGFIMLIGLISDIHGNAPALEAVLHHLHGRVDRVLFMGDFAGYYPFVNECIEMMPAEIVTGVRGNHDQILLDFLSTGGLPENYRDKYGSALERSVLSLSDASKKYLSNLPIQQHLKIEGLSIAIMHGSPWDPLNGRVYPDFLDWHRFNSCNHDIILIGHTHYSLEKKIGDMTIINPGSVGQPRDGEKDACFAILDISSRKVQFHRVAYNPLRIIEDARIHDPENKYLVQVLQ
jgi:putative phosphoesterase